VGVCVCARARASVGGTDVGGARGVYASASVFVSVSVSVNVFVS